MNTSRKTRVLFLAPYPFGRVASQRFRFEQYWDVLETRYELTFQSFLSEKSFSVLYQDGRVLLKALGVLAGFGRRVRILFKLAAVDFVFIHREASPVGPPVFEWIIARLYRKRIIYDFDDAIWLKNTSGENRSAAFAKCHWKVKYLCSWAVKVTCGNNFLGDYARKYNVNVSYLPTTIDLKHIPVKSVPVSRPKLKTLGWTGTHSTLKYLQKIVPVLQRLQNHMPFRFIVIADKDPKLPLINYEFKTWSRTTEWNDLLTVDIGLMPLETTEWEEGKCGFKALQYMALGIPALASPTAANKQIINNSINGFICNSDEDWKKNIMDVLENDALSDMLSGEGRRKMAEKYSKLVWTETYLSLFI